MLCHGQEQVQLAEWTWKCKATLTCEIFIWLTLRHRLWTSNRRARHGLQDTPEACHLSDQEVDAVEHIMVQYCVYAGQVWTKWQQRALIKYRPPENTYFGGLVASTEEQAGEKRIKRTLDTWIVWHPPLTHVAREAVAPCVSPGYPDARYDNAHSGNIITQSGPKGYKWFYMAIKAWKQLSRPSMARYRV